MKIKYHVASSGIMAYIVYLASNSVSNAMAAFLAGVFIDLDHFLDYYLNYGFNHRLNEIYDVIDKFALPRVYLFLHSYELLAFFWIFIFLVPLKGIYIALAIGFTQHLFLDQIFNPIVRMGYFLSYRIANRFKIETLINPNRLK